MSAAGVEIKTDAQALKVMLNHAGIEYSINENPDTSNYTISFYGMMPAGQGQIKFRSSWHFSREGRVQTIDGDDRP